MRGARDRVGNLSLLGFVSHDPLKRGEADKLRGRVVQALQVLFAGVDWLVSQTNGEHRDCEIWALDEEEAQTLADAWLTVAATNVAFAVGARVAAELADRYQVGAILLPRFVRTWQFYARHGGMVLPPVIPARRPRRPVAPPPMGGPNAGPPYASSSNGVADARVPS